MKDLMNMTDFAELLDISRTKTWQMIKEGDVPPLYDLNPNGKKANYRVDREDVEPWLKAHAINPLPGTELTPQDVQEKPWLNGIIEKQMGDERYANQAWVQNIVGKKESPDSGRGA